MQKESAIREPLILGDKTYHQITEDVCAPVEGKANKYWYMAFLRGGNCRPLGGRMYTYTPSEEELETWGLNTTVDWAWDITNFVWWVGIGHAGTLISAVSTCFSDRSGGWQLTDLQRR